MRKFWMVLLALGLVVAFSMPAFAAVDGKFSGSLRVRGWYDDNLLSLDKDKYNGAGARQFFDNRLRMQPEFKIAEGLTLTTRFDALEKKWGQTLSTPAAVDFNDSIKWERAYVTFNTKFGIGMVGYQASREFGTVFGNSSGSDPRVKWMVPVSDFTFFGVIEKLTEDTANAGLNVDSDKDRYQLGAIYKFKGGDAGLQVELERNATARTAAATPYKREFYVFEPYVKYKAGPVYVEAEAFYATGDWAKYEQGTTVPKPSDIKFDSKAFYLLANMDFSPMYAGFLFAYGSGDDPDTTDKVEGGLFRQQSLNSSWNASLMLQSYEYRNQMGGERFGNAGAGNGLAEYTDNIWFYQIYAGVKPMKELDVKLSLSYAYADKKPKTVIAGVPTEFVSDKYGTELDLTAAYKIYDNLEYMVGFGYLWTGDYFKGTDNAAVTANDYLVMHQLMLSF